MNLLECYLPYVINMYRVYRLARTNEPLTTVSKKVAECFTR